jgi:5-methylcytosine-specific restriction enzyme A
MAGLYSTARWVRVARNQLQTHPLCRVCWDRGVITAAEVVDHVIPHKGDAVAFYMGELQSLCRPHHDRTKQQQEKRGYSSDVGDDGYPLDPKHPANQGARGE